MKKPGKRYSTGVQTEIDDLMEYYHALSDEEKRFAMQFYREYYANALYDIKEEKLIMKRDEDKKDNRRRHNSIHRDAISRSNKAGVLEYLGEDDNRFMNDAVDEFQWMDAFKIGGYEFALKTITSQTEEEIKTGGKLELILNRYYLKRESLRKIWNTTTKEDR